MILVRRAMIFAIESPIDKLNKVLSAVDHFTARKKATSKKYLS